MNLLEEKSGLITVYNADSEPMTVKVIIDTNREELTIITVWADGKSQTDYIQYTAE